MIKKYNISKDNTLAKLFPDLILLNNILISVFVEYDFINKIFNLCFIKSFDKGITWTEKEIISERINEYGRFDAPRINKIDDQIIIMSTWYLNDDKDKQNSYVYLWRYDLDLNLIEKYKTEITGIVPDKIIVLDNKWLITTHERNNKLQLLKYFSYDKGKTWTKKEIMYQDNNYNLCETTIIKVDTKLVGIIRENSNKGIDALKIISNDSGATWSGLYNLPIPGCHRPVVTKLKNENYLITYRYNPSITKKGTHGCNFMGCILKENALLNINRDEIEVRIFPIDYDRNINPNCGYSGVVQFDDGMIYVVSFIVDDNPVAQLRGYSFYLSDIIINSR